MIKFNILNLISIVKNLKLCCILIAVLVSKYPQVREAGSSVASNTNVTFHLRRIFPAALTPDKHIVWIRVFRQTEEKNHFLPLVSVVTGLSSNENKISLRNAFSVSTK